MKFKSIAFLLATILLVSGCNSNQTNGSGEPFGSSTSSETNNNQQETNNNHQETNNNSQQETNKDDTPKKVTVNAHTLKDSNPPIDISSQGQRVSESTWNSFKNGSTSKFNGNYNYTYSAIVGYQQIAFEEFTKNGYHLKSQSGELFYERKSGSAFYNYVKLSGEYQRLETTFDLQSKYTSRIVDEIRVHMFDFDEYEYDDYDGTYWLYTTSYAAAVRFQGGYLTYLHYALSGGTAIYDIQATFETTINIPESYI